ncbi:hypothetical protein AB205_0068730, partial [Aquarana catesbeiana]
MENTDNTDNRKSGDVIQQKSSQFSQSLQAQQAQHSAAQSVQRHVIIAQHSPNSGSATQRTPQSGAHSVQQLTNTTQYSPSSGSMIQGSQPLQPQQAQQSAAHRAQSRAETSVSPSTPRKYTRTSLEQKTIKENLQQCVMVDSGQGRSLRSKLQQNKEGGNNSPQSAPVKPSTLSRDPQTSTGNGKVDQDFKRYAAVKQKGLKSEPALHLADKIPFLVKRMETLRKAKARIQKQIECVYRLKAANPKKEMLYDSKLNSLGIELAGVSKDIDAVLEELGPVAEVYRNCDQFEVGLSGRIESSTESDSGDSVQRTQPPHVSPEGKTVQPLEDSEVGADPPAGLPALEDSGNISITQQTFTVQETQRSDMVDSQHMDCENSAAATSTPGGSHAGVTGVHGGSNTGVTSNDAASNDDMRCSDDVTNIDVVNNSDVINAGISEWGHQQSEGSENVTMEESVQNNPQDFPPLVDPPPAPQGTAGPCGHVPPRNAWSRGAPSFSTSNSYTGQAFKRRNVVRLKHRGSREELPDRRFVVRELLCHQMGFAPADILAAINLPDRQGYDVSFKLMSDLDRFWASFSGLRDKEVWRNFIFIPISKPDTANVTIMFWNEQGYDVSFKLMSDLDRFWASFSGLRDKEGWRNFIFIPISKPDTANVTIMFWNESVPPQDVVIWLRRHCEMVSELTKTKDSDGIWTGGWRVLVKLRQSNNVTHHLPNSFFIGRERGVCFYAGQPRLCYKCGKSGHVTNVCTILKCNLCGEVGHISSTCEKVKCNLCGGLGHFHRDCPEAFHNKDGESADNELLAAAEQLEEEVLMNGAVLTREEVVPEVQETTPGRTDSVQQAEEQPAPHSSSVPVPVSVKITGQKRRNRKKDKSTRKPESDWTLVQKSAKKVKGPPEVGTAVSTN